MSLRYLLDTNIISDPIAKRPNPKITRRIEKYDLASCIASPVLHEMIFGCELLKPSERKTTLERYIKEVVQPSFPILPYDEPAASWHAKERARLSQRGETPAFVDGQIAAIAKIAGLILVTANPKHFRVFDGVRVENWAQ